MEPFVTLHHFTNPLWIADSRGWLNPDVVSEFTDYARRMAQAYGHLVDEWITINEPFIYAMGTYWAKTFPGGSLLNMEKTKKALVHMIRAHAAAYDAIREVDLQDADNDGNPCRITLVKALHPIYPADPNDPDDVAAAGRIDGFHNRQIYDALIDGRLSPWLEPEENSRGGREGASGFHPELAGRMDSIAINYYSPWYAMHVPMMLYPLEALPCFSFIEPLCFPGGRPDVVRGDNGNEVYPEGLLEVFEAFASYGLPLMVTENGIATTDERKRSWFLVQHLEQLQKAREKGYPVEGYFHWSLLDNFEWLEGFAMRFGLYSVDFKSFERTPTEAVEAYRRIIHSGRVTSEIRDSYPWP